LSHSFFYQFFSSLKILTKNNLKILFFSVGGMNRSHRLSQGAKKVTPPSIPSFNYPAHRGSGSSFGSDYSNDREDSHHPLSSFSRAPNGDSSAASSPAFTKLTFEADVIPRRGSNTPKVIKFRLATNKIGVWWMIIKIPVLSLFIKMLLVIVKIPVVGLLSLHKNTTYRNQNLLPVVLLQIRHLK
jgi:hypothetical protein